jgi:uncharacterized protein YprB with RNaseH-like and TPR domain
MGKIKRLFFDIETSPNIGLFWKAGYKLNIGHDNIIKERAIICICYKWAGEKEVHSLTWDAKQDDKSLLEKFIKIANEADELVGHNGDKYDLPWVRTRCLYHGLSLFPSYVTTDTLKYARSKFSFNSNKLDYIAQFLGLGAKIHTGFNLWKDIVLNKDKKAMDQMVEYCKGDVVLLEKIYNKLAPHFPEKIHTSEDKADCPTCGSNKWAFTKRRMSALGTTRVQMQCKKCGRYHTVSEKTYESVTA